MYSANYLQLHKQDFSLKHCFRAEASAHDKPSWSKTKQRYTV